MAKYKLTHRNHPDKVEIVTDEELRRINALGAGALYRKEKIEEKKIATPKEVKEAVAESKKTKTKDGSKN